MTHADDARRIALKFYEEGNDFLIEGLTIEIAAALAAADAAGERRGIERAADFVSKDFTQEKDCTSHCVGGCRSCSPGAVLGQAERAIRALLPAAVAEPCAHEWVNARNVERGGAVESGWCCGKCGAVRAIPAEPAAKCATCETSGRPGFIVTGFESLNMPTGPRRLRPLWNPCPACAGGGA